MDFDRVRAETEALRLDGVRYRCVPYIDEMGKAYRTADLVVSRAGATTIAEVTALGIASILIPYPFATANHQELNARWAEQAGATRVVPNDRLDGETLFSAATEILRDDALLDSMRRASARIGRPDAAEVLAGIVLGLIEERQTP